MYKVLPILLLLFLIACGGDAPSSAAEPVELPTAAAPASIDLETTPGDSPRTSNDEDGAGLPPTFTPAPTAVRDDVATVVFETNPAGTPLVVTTEAVTQQTYTVQAGDTLAEIAAAFDISVEALAQANDINDVDQIEVGDVLVIP